VRNFIGQLVQLDPANLKQHRRREQKALCPIRKRDRNSDPVGAAVDAAFAGGYRLLLRQAIAHVLEASIGQGEPLHPMHARDANAAEVGKGRDPIAASPRASTRM
jgi:hypothetical protein